MVTYGMKKLVFLHAIGDSRRVEKMCKINREVVSQRDKGQIQNWTEYEPWYAQIED
jgi:hypothetical protein